MKPLGRHSVSFDPFEKSRYRWQNIPARDPSSCHFLRNRLLWTITNREDHRSNIFFTGVMVARVPSMASSDILLNVRRYFDGVLLPLTTSVLLSTVNLISPFSVVLPIPAISYLYRSHHTNTIRQVADPFAQVSNRFLLYRQTSIFTVKNSSFR